MRRAAQLLPLLLLTPPAGAQTTAPQTPAAQPAALTAQATVALNLVPATRVARSGVTVPGTPAALNTSVTVRYGPSRPAAVLLLMPGYLGGAGSFDRLARQLVHLDPTLAVWAVDRRSNLLEDHAPLLSGNATQLAQVVQRGLPTRDPATLTYMKDWGLDTTLRDWRAAVLEARTLTPNVFIGGHSMGGTLTGLYATYDFGGVRGERDVQGLIMLDGLPGLMSGKPLSLDQYEKGGGTNPIGSLPGLQQLNRAPFVSAPYFSPDLATRAAAQARLAALQPDARAPQGGFASFPATNLAAAMTRLDRRYALLPFMAISAGRATNATDAPFLPSQALGGQDTRWITGATDPARPVGWASDPTQLTDALDFVQRYLTPLTDYTEWYFPNRLTLDLAAARTDTTGTPFERSLPVRSAQTLSLPVLGIAAEQGVTTAEQFRAYAAGTRAKLTTYTLKGAAHLDVTTASSDQVARRIVTWLRPLRR
ncbi:alpha/beta fold hydrolase [Deinococcus radiotolerans]|uniref:Alpha/beta hydrolase n=1 Tax=Deinococcus radiotolerans TaxID=1309407 RepID=A0ABQ2FK59_9DEIO|nr:alpha/beta hydrolase [Deinococcus radiotolerans]GGL04254.1 alpha/beta hydrolase [Deinococcus radiotolerans]